ncbi:uncharacterized protein V1518DRAFT_445682 [Limtongia smithiae]|uniref:uncharacterized protein n=1 Tax=Limtongia smithiae TaxID=1125753 RepID=UPI0034CE8406
MGFLTDHPYTAITVTIDRLVTDAYEEDDVAGIYDLIETIRLSSTGPTEAARAIRKKLKYGSVHNQLRALTILDSLIVNGGKRFQASFADEPLLERMRILATDSFTDPTVKKKMGTLFLKWANAYKDTSGMQQVAQLYKQLPQRKRAPPKKQRFLEMDDDMEDEDEHPAHGEGAAAEEERERPAMPTRPANRERDDTASSSSSGGAARSSSRRARTTEERERSVDRRGSMEGQARNSKHLRTNPPPTAHRTVVRANFDLEKEKPLLLQTLAEAGTYATNLSNSLKLINREKELAPDNMKATENFNKCRQLRRKILRYIQYIESEDFIGSLLHANDELVAALQLYDNMSQPIDEDSDSEDYDSEADDDVAPAATRHAVHLTAEQLAHKRKPPPVPMKKSQLAEEFKAKVVISQPVEDEDNPFGDSHIVETPAVERTSMSWNS